MTVDAFERQFVKPRTGRTLIVGSRVYNDKPDRRALYKPGEVLGVDMIDGPGVDRVLDLEQGAWIDIPFFHIECMSVLEHTRRPWLMAETIESLLMPGGTLFVTVPWIWPVHAYPFDHWRVSIESLEVLFPNIEWKARRYVNQRVLEEGEKIERLKNDEGYPYFPRTETCGFGVRK